MILIMGSQMSLYGNFSCDSVQAPLIFMLTFGMAGKAQHPWKISPWLRQWRGWNGCCSPRWSMTSMVLGFLGRQPRCLFEASPGHEVSGQ